MKPAQITILSDDNVHNIQTISKVLKKRKRDTSNQEDFLANSSKPPDKQRRRPLLRTAKEQSWKRVSLRPHQEDIGEAKEQYEHTVDYIHYNVDEELSSLLPQKGLTEDLFPTCVPKLQSEEMGRGLMTLESIPKGSEIGEYVGEFRTTVPEDRQYLMDCGVEDTLFIDARCFGNYMRFCNHSCDPNASVVGVCRDGFERLMIVAERDIQENEFITIEYKEPPRDCKCGAAKCAVQHW